MSSRTHWDKFTHALIYFKKLRRASEIFKRDLCVSRAGNGMICE